MGNNGTSAEGVDVANLVEEWNNWRSMEFGRWSIGSGKILEFFTTEPYACEPSSLPKYPPSKEMDVKLRHKEARRFTFLSFFMFTMSWINIRR
ncbi:hypothetical protein Q3G72_008440 [Acer saccharum]|nr:hypothetical protein Q3G72_008440 [Acer saccharum]